MTQPSQSFQPLDNGLVLRAVETDADAEQVSAINAEIHGPDVGAIVRRWLFEGHPATSRPDWLFVADTATGQAVATLGLLPTTWRYATQSLRVAELGMVATRPDYRRQGLQRALYAVYEPLALERGCVLGAIEGIPGFYNQFGHEYAVPLDAKIDLNFEQIPDAAPQGYAARPAHVKDTPVLRRLYDASIAALDLAALRSAALWEHQLSAPQSSFYGFTTVIERQGQIAGYMRWNDDDWSDRLRILELAVGDGPGVRECLLVALHLAAEQARASTKSGLRLNLPANHPAVTLAHYLGAVDRGHYGWQIKVLDAKGFIQAIRPALEARLEGSLLAGYTGSLIFDLYRSRLALRFDTGKLVEVGKPTEKVRADLGITLEQATQLWLGWRGREALEAWYPDFWTRAEARHLLDVLFPAMRAFIYMPY